jgi:putative ABC transport system permease protein
VVFEVGLAMILLTGATLMIRSFIRLQQVDLGFDAANVLTVRISLPETKYSQAHQQESFFQQLLEQTAALPGVEETGVITELPVGGGNSAFPIAVEGRSEMPSAERPIAFYNAVSSDYFRAMRISLMRGRSFNEKDAGETSPKVMIIDEMLAGRYWPGEDPIDKRLIIVSGKPTSYEIVGVVKTVRYHSIESSGTIPATYVPFHQSPQSRMVLVMRSASDPTSLATVVRNEVRTIDEDQPVSQITLMDHFISEALSQKRFYTWLLSLFGVVALLLSAIGIYGVVSYTVTQRTREIGIRLALGAPRGSIFKLIIGEHLSLIVVGVLLGFAGALALTRFLASLLYEVTTTDALSFMTVVAILAGTALFACYIPSRKAVQVDPITALRHE